MKRRWVDEWGCLAGAASEFARWDGGVPFIKDTAACGEKQRCGDDDGSDSSDFSAATVTKWKALADVARGAALKSVRLKRDEANFAVDGAASSVIETAFCG
jgi:hypothetical protein